MEIVVRFRNDLRAWHAEHESLQATETDGNVSRHREGLNTGEARKSSRLRIAIVGYDL